MATVKFKAALLIRGINPYVLVSRRQADQLKVGWRKPLPVLVRVNGQPTQRWHVNMMPVGDGSFYLYLHGAMRKAASSSVGDIVSIELDFDSAYRSGPAPMPEWFARALSANPSSQANWDQLQPSRQKEIIRYLTNLKSAEAQDRNVVRAMSALSGNQVQFMGRPWRNGS